MLLFEFALLVVATVAAIAAGLAVVASSFRIARGLFWAAALSFGSMGIVSSANSSASLPIQMMVSAIVAAIAAAGLTYGLWDLRIKEAAAQIDGGSENSKPKSQENVSTKNSPNISAGGDVNIGHIGDVINNGPIQPGPQDVGVLKPPAEVLLSGGKVNRTMEFGNSGAKITFGGREGEALFKFFERSALVLESVGGRLMVSSELFDDDGKLAVELIRNEWKVAPPPKTWDRNYTDNALEVRNPKGAVILQVRMLPDRIQLQGEWRSENGEGVQIMQLPHPKTGEMSGAIVLFKKENEAQFRGTIKPIFRYPSALHLGELIK
jgi:hypothetical protein